MGRSCVPGGIGWLAGGQVSVALECPGVHLAEEHPGGAARGSRGMDPWRSFYWAVGHCGGVVRGPRGVDLVCPSMS